MAEQLPTVYEPRSIEEQAMGIWDRGNYFHAEPDGKGNEDSYTIVIPPPNVTAALHLGHALNNTLQDILIRYRRMQGKKTLWMPGTDHAGIATQTVVDKRLRAEGKAAIVDYKKMEEDGQNGREQFIAKVQSWKDEYETCILGQLKAMGCSCDWERTRFTMDEVCAKAVRTNFYNLFKDKLIYRGKRLVNWDPATQTVLADDEVEHHNVAGHFWYMKYPLCEAVEIDGEMFEHVTVATTRPETMLGDTAIAMSPSDPRAKALVGKKVRLPIVGRIIPIVADEHVVLPNAESDDEKARFSTGFLKVTPAHDPDDWQIGLRHGLEVINIMAPDGSISCEYDWTDWEDVKNPDVENIIGMDRFEARKAIVEWFRQENLLAEVREYSHEIGHSYRSHVPIEPYLSDQWYIAVKKPIEHLAEKFGEGLIAGTDVPKNSLAGLALKPLIEEKVRFIPDRYSKTYRSWLENLRDWPISRQLWWGHRIPVWLCEDCGKYCSGIDDPEKCEHCGSDKIEQDPDVLDTWFSSALWPFSTLGWPGGDEMVKEFYPTSVLCTAREIITLWVSRMVMMGQYCVGDIPFNDVYIHAMIQDGQGRKMSKSLGNGIDPLVVIDSHGADAMRFTLATMATETQDIRMPVAPMKLPDGREVNTSPKFDNGRNFCNKLWNASRFAMMNLEGTEPEKFSAEDMTVADKWILSKLMRVIKETSESLDDFKYSEPMNALYKFFWNDLCDWYLEWVKPRMQDEKQKGTAANVLAFVLDQTLRLMHPFIPFITEGIFGKLNELVPCRKLGAIADAGTSEALVVGKWPEYVAELVDEDAEGTIELLQNQIRAIRDVASKYNLTPAKMTVATAAGPEGTVGILNANSDLICGLTGLKGFSAGVDTAKPDNAATAIVDDVQIYVHDVIDAEEEIARLEKQKEQVAKGLAGVNGKLGNENFVSRAKPEVVEQARNKQKELQEQLKMIEGHLADLKNGK